MASLTIADGRSIEFDVRETGGYRVSRNAAGSLDVDVFLSRNRTWLKGLYGLTAADEPALSLHMIFSRFGGFSMLLPSEGSDVYVLQPQHPVAYTITDHEVSIYVEWQADPIVIREKETLPDFQKAPAIKTSTFDQVCSLLRKEKRFEEGLPRPSAPISTAKNTFTK